MKKIFVMLIISAGVLLAPIMNVFADTANKSQDVTYMETPEYLLHDDEWLKENDPLYEKYANQNVLTRSVSDLSAYGYTNTEGEPINWGEGLNHDPRFDKYKRVWGIDVSHWQGDIDWQQVKDSGVEFAIIKLGGRALKDGTLYPDEKFEYNIKSAHDAGIKIGVYFYSQSINLEEVEAEAEYVNKNLKKYKSYLSFPVFYDFEWSDTSRVGLMKKKMTSQEWTNYLTSATLTFCKKITSYGYKAGEYGSKSKLESMMDMSKVEDKYFVWLARYTKNYNAGSTATKDKSYQGKYLMWQFSDGSKEYENQGIIIRYKIPGINANVDLDVFYQSKPDKLENLVVTGNTTSSISLKWNTISIADGYQVVVLNSKDEVINSIEVKGTSVKVSDLKAGTIYKFKVRAYSLIDGKAYGAYSSVVEFVTKPTKVQNIKRKAYGLNDITLTWDKVQGASGYKIYLYNATTDKYALVASTNETTYKVAELNAAKKYKFKVTAYKEFDGKQYNAAASDEFEVATKTKKVTGLKITANSSTSISLSWTKQSGVTAYEVRCYDAKSNLINKVITDKNTNSLVYKSLNSGTTYIFKVRSYIKTVAAGTSYGDCSSPVKMVTKPAKVKNVIAKSVSKSSITISWDKVKGASGYKVYAYNEKTKKSTLIKTTTSLSFKATKLKNAKKYSYKVVAYKKLSDKIYSGAASSVITVATTPGATTSIKQTAKSKNSITIKWKKVAGATNYKIYRCDKAGKVLKRFDTKKTSFTDKNLKSGKYVYKIRAYIHTEAKDSYGSYSKSLTARTK